MILHRKIVLVAVFSCFWLVAVNAANSDSTQLVVLFEKMAVAASSADQITLAKEAETKLVAYLKTHNTDELTPLKIPHLGRIEADNRLMAIYTWNVPLADAGNHYFGVLHYKTTKKKRAQVVVLSDATDMISVSRKIAPKQWYGALYYTILSHKVKKKTHYVVMGWDGHNSLVTRKIIDVITVARNGNVSLGAPVFEVDSRYQNRVVFQYSAEVQMMLQYDANKKLIVFDHLMPIEKRYTGFFEYYSPSFSYDGYKLKKQKWRLQSDLDLRNAE